MAEEEKEETKKEEEDEKEEPKQEEKPAAAAKAPAEEEKPAATPEAAAAKPQPPPKFAKLIGEIESLSVSDLAELVKALEERFGVSAAPAVGQAPAAPAGAAAGAPAPAEEKVTRTVVLQSSGPNKIAVIKAVREIKPDLGLKEAKDLVEAAPKEVLSEVKREVADEAKQKLEAAGATVEVK